MLGDGDVTSPGIGPFRLLKSVSPLSPPFKLLKENLLVAPRAQAGPSADWPKGARTGPGRTSCHRPCFRRLRFGGWESHSSTLGAAARGTRCGVSGTDQENGASPGTPGSCWVWGTVSTSPAGGNHADSKVTVRTGQCPLVLRKVTQGPPCPSSLKSGLMGGEMGQNPWGWGPRPLSLLAPAAAAGRA